MGVFTAINSIIWRMEQGLVLQTSLLYLAHHLIPTFFTFLHYSNYTNTLLVPYESGSVRKITYWATGSGRCHCSSLALSHFSLRPETQTRLEPL